MTAESTDQSHPREIALTRAEHDLKWEQDNPNMERLTINRPGDIISGAVYIKKNSGAKRFLLIYLPEFNKGGSEQ